MPPQVIQKSWTVGMVQISIGSSVLMAIQAIPLIYQMEIRSMCFQIVPLPQSVGIHITGGAKHTLKQIQQVPSSIGVMKAIGVISDAISRVVTEIHFQLPIAL